MTETQFVAWVWGKKQTLTGYGTIRDFNTISLFEICKKDELDSRKQAAMQLLL